MDARTIAVAIAGLGWLITLIAKGFIQREPLDAADMAALPALLTAVLGLFKVEQSYIGRRRAPRGSVT